MGGIYHYATGKKHLLEHWGTIRGGRNNFLIEESQDSVLCLPCDINSLPQISSKCGTSKAPLWGGASNKGARNGGLGL